MSNDNIYKKLNNLRNDFKNTKISKSGHNQFQGFKYYELKDFMPTIIELNKKHGLCTYTNINDTAILTVVNADNIDEKIKFELKVPQIGKEKFDKKLNEVVPIGFNEQVQDTGRLETYMRRYLYMLYAEITDDDEIDNKDNRGSNSKTKKVVKKKPFVKPNYKE